MSLDGTQESDPKKRWLNLMRSFDVPDEAARPIFEDLLYHYSENGRYYHNLAHVQRVLNTVATLEDLAKNLRAIQLAAWFHDVIYDSHADDNEAKSAAYARDVLEDLNLPQETIKRVVELIEATTHTFPVDDIDAQILLDADLAPLGAQKADFIRQTQAIRKEFGWIPEDLYQANRLVLMNRFLARERIYYTHQLYSTLEEQARNNIRSEIKALSA